MPGPALIGVAAGEHDRAVISTILRSVLDEGRPYERVGVVGPRETYDGVDFLRDATCDQTLGRLDERIAHARTAGLTYLVLELPEDVLAEKDLGSLDLLCTLGAGGAGTVRGAGRGLSFSTRSPLADVGSSRERAGYGYVQFHAHAPSWDGEVALPLPGIFNVAPALAAIATLELLGKGGREVQERLLTAGAQGHGELLFPPEQHVCALLEQSSAPRDQRLAVQAAREEFEGFAVEVVEDLDAVEPAVARGYRRAESTMLVLLGRPGAAYADAFQAAVRRHFRWSGPPRGWAGGTSGIVGGPVKKEET